MRKIVCEKGDLKVKKKKKKELLLGRVNGFNAFKYL